MSDDVIEAHEPEHERVLLNDLKKKTPAELLAMAEELEVEGASLLSKQELMFGVLKELAERDVEIIGVKTLPTASLRHRARRLIMTVRRFDFRQRAAQQKRGVSVITVPDQRWGRVDIKSTGLLANVMAKQDARAQGSFEAWFTAPDGTVREGGSTSAYIVKNGTLITHPLSAHILPGSARQTLLRLAREAQIPVEERPFSLG